MYYKPSKTHVTPENTPDASNALYACILHAAPVLGIAHVAHVTYVGVDYLSICLTTLTSKMYEAAVQGVSLLSFFLLFPLRCVLEGLCSCNNHRFADNPMFTLYVSEDGQFIQLGKHLAKKERESAARKEIYSLVMLMKRKSSRLPQLPPDMLRLLHSHLKIVL